MKRKLFIMVIWMVSLAFFTACEEDRGAKPFDGTEYTTSQWPQVESFYPTSAKVGDEITITGKNLSTVTDVTFGNTPAYGFTCVSDIDIKATVAAGSHSGAVAVTNHKGTKALKGFKFLEPKIGGNLALGSTATASNEEFTPPSNVVADNTDVYWAPNAGITAGKWDSWILLELPEASDLDEIVVKWFHNDSFTNNDPKSFDVQISTDGISFTNVGSVSTEASFLHETTETYDYTMPFTKVVGVRFVKLVINESFYQPMLAEIEAYCRNSAPVASNLALGSSGTSSSNFGATVPGNVVTGNMELYWAPTDYVRPAEGNSPEWICLELPESSELNRIVVKWYNEGGFENNDPKDYEVQVSSDGTTFETVGAFFTDKSFLHESCCDGHVQIVDFLNRSGINYIRIFIKESTWQPMLAEVEAYRIENNANLTPGSTGTSSSNFGATVPGNVVMGDMEFYWAPTDYIRPAEGNSPEWICLELPESSEIGRIIVRWYNLSGFENNDPKDYEVQVSSDGTTFETVGAFFTDKSFLHESCCDGHVQVVGFQKRSGIGFIRVYIKESTWQPMLAEVEAYNL